MTEDIDDVVEMSCEGVHTAELIPGRLQNLHASKRSLTRDLEKQQAEPETVLPVGRQWHHGVL